MENLLDFRQKINKKLLDKNIKVSINDIVIKARARKHCKAILTQMQYGLEIN